MKYYSHQATSLVLGQVVYTQLGLTNPLMFFVPVFISSIAADMDTRKSKFNKYNPIAFITTKFGHRKLTHSILGLFIYLAVCNALFHKWPIIVLGAGVGYLGHLLGDFLTVMGVPFLYPYEKHFRFFIHFKTGSAAEAIVFILSLVGLYYLGFYNVLLNQGLQILKYIQSLIM